MDERYRLRPAELADVAALARLERACFSDPWTPAQLRAALGWPAAVAIVAAGDTAVIGYVLGRVVVDQGEVLSIGIDPAWRRQGIGRRLLDAALDTMAERGATTVWLEVRESNAAAREMYRRAGFVADGLRRNYYRRPAENALVLRRHLG